MYLKSHNFGKKLDAAKYSRGDQIVLVMNWNGFVEDQVVKKIRENGS